MSKRDQKGDGGDGEEEHAAEHGRHGHKKIHNKFHGEDHEEGEPWLLSYADMVTLLMCFFILFFSVDKNTGGIQSPERLKRKLSEALGIEATNAELFQARAELKQLKAGLASDLYKMNSNLKVVFALTFPDPETLNLTFLSNNFFAPGESELTDSARESLKGIADRLKALTTPGLFIEIDGYTDSDPVKSGKFPSNWELSGARAAAVARQLIALGLPSKKIQISAFADTRPVLPEHDNRNVPDITAKRMNRRVEIKLKIRGAKGPAANAAEPSGAGDKAAGKPKGK